MRAATPTNSGCAMIGDGNTDGRGKLENRMKKRMDGMWGRTDALESSLVLLLLQKNSLRGEAEAEGEWRTDGHLASL